MIFCRNNSLQTKCSLCFSTTFSFNYRANIKGKWFCGNYSRKLKFLWIIPLLKCTSTTVFVMTVFAVFLVTLVEWRLFIVWIILWGHIKNLYPFIIFKVQKINIDAFHLTYTTEIYIKKILRDTKVHKAAGIDELLGLFWKMFHEFYQNLQVNGAISLSNEEVFPTLVRLQSWHLYLKKGKKPPVPYQFFSCNFYKHRN